MKLQEEATAQAVRRLRRVEGQVAGVVRMLEEGRSCQEIVTQLAAASKALDRAAFQMLANGLQQCVASPDSDMTPEQITKLFLSLA